MGHSLYHCFMFTSCLHLGSSYSFLLRRGSSNLQSRGYHSCYFFLPIGFEIEVNVPFTTSTCYDPFSLKCTGKFALWMIPQLFAYAANFPIQKFLQSQRKVLVMAWISGVVLIIHAVFSWLFILYFKWGLVGAAITLNTSWWLIVIGQLLYILITKSDGAWTGFSWLAFRDLYGFVRLSLASALMLWYQSIFG